MSVDQETLVQSVNQLSLSVNEKLKSAPILMIGKTEFKFDPNDLDEEYVARAMQELRETQETIEEGLKKLRELIKGESDLKIPTDKVHLQKFLRPCKWYADSSFELMKNFYKYRLSHPKYCSNLIPSHERAILMSGILTPLPRRSDDGCRVILIESGRKWKPKEITLNQIFRGVILFLEAAMVEPKTQVAGVRVMIDMEGLSLSQVTYFTPTFAAAVSEFVQRCLPCRLKGIHIINQPYIFNMVFAFFRPFLQEKLRKRIHFHATDRASLRTHIGSKSLPQKYGGELEFPDEAIGEPFVNYLCLFDDDFLESNKHGYISKT